MRKLPWIVLLVAVFAADGFSEKFYEDDPLIREPQPRAVEKIASRKLSDYYDILSHTLATPGIRPQKGQKILAQGVNTLGDPMEGAWWERRHYWKRMTAADLQRGPGDGMAPAIDGQWTVVSAKTEGITPGFVIIDRNKRRYYVKFDPPQNPEIASGADQISSKIFYALGYHVPENYLVHFGPEILQLGEDVTVEDRLGRRRTMTNRDLSEILMRVHRGKDGQYRATASLALAGKTVGPYRYFGTRRDDPNDTVPHEHRRDLRGMYLACALVNHDDSRSINTIDVLTDGPSGKFIKHYQLDFGSTLGSASDKINSPRSGGEYLFAWKNALVQLVTLGLAVPRWALADYPDLKSVGRFESKVFDPDAWVPEYPNPAFLNRLPDDEFWMAKQIASLSNDDLRAIVKTAEYSDAKAADWIARCLEERRDKIVRSAFSKVLPLDRFEVREGRLQWTDLAAAFGFGGISDTSIRWSEFNNDQETSTSLTGESTIRLPAMPGNGYWLAEISSPSRPAQQVRVYVRKRGDSAEVVGVEWTW